MAGGAVVDPVLPGVKGAGGAEALFELGEKITNGDDGLDAPEVNAAGGVPAEFDPGEKMASGSAMA